MTSVTRASGQPVGTPRVALIDEILELEQSLCQAMGPLQAGPWLDVDLTMAQLKTLLTVGAAAETQVIGGTRMTDLARLLGVTPGTVSTLVDRLVERGLIERREDPQDRRQHRCQLSVDGRELVARLAESGRTRTRVLFTQLDSAELEVVRRSVQMLIEAAERLQVTRRSS